jgi:carbon storage regulator
VLVLSRKAGETIYIGDSIAITVCRIGLTQVRIGIEAPKEVPILRSELPECADRSPLATRHSPLLETEAA